MTTKEVLIALQREAQGQLDIFIQNEVNAKETAEFNIIACEESKRIFEDQIETATNQIARLTSKRAELDEVITIIENSDIEESPA